MSSRRRWSFLTILAAAAAILNLPHYLYAGESQTRKPNILFILMDDMGWKDPGFMGGDFYETPNINWLAREGMVFTDAYANAPNCAPTRACIMTGQYTPRHGVYTVNSSIRGDARQRKLVPIENTRYLAPTHITIAEALKSAGYVTFHGGKWHLGDNDATWPQGQGFDVNIGGCQHGGPMDGYFAPFTAPNLQDAPAGAHLCDYITDRTLEFITENKDTPFFVYLAFYDVHGPLQAKEPIIEKYRKKNVENQAKGIKTKHSHPVYAAMVENTDANIGRILERLDKLGIAENTVVLFFSDNGGWGGATNMRPLRGCKGMLYEGGIREPMIMRWPGKIAAGTSCDVPVISIDFYPTFLEIAGTSKPPGTMLDGESLVPLLRQTGGLERDAIFWHFPCYLKRLPKAFKRDSRDGIWRATPCSVVRKGHWKCIEYFEDGALELYDVKEDIGERKNLADEMPVKAKELHNVLKHWRERVNAPVPTERNPAFDPNALSQVPGKTKRR